MVFSKLQELRYGYEPKMPQALQAKPEEIKMIIGEPTDALQDKDELKKLFKNSYGLPLVHFEKGKSETFNSKALKIGFILSGGQAPGGHNVISGLFDSLKKANSKSELIGFLGGPSGLVDGKYITLTKDKIDEYRNTGGFDMIGSGRTKIETDEQVESSIKTVNQLSLDAIVIAGGDDSNTNAALLAEKFLNAGLKTKVIGIPKTIDNDLKGDLIETSFGFDTAAKTYSEVIGNICRDTNSAKKYWHFIRVMGRSASHIALECGLQTQANICLIAEEVAEKNMTLKEVTNYIADIIEKRAKNGENFGVIIVPEGLIEFIPEVKKLIAELNDVLALKKDDFAKRKTYTEQQVWLTENISKSAKKTFEDLPEEISRQLLIDRDPHGNVQVSRIETEKLLIATVKHELERRQKAGTYNGKFSSYAHFFGYEGRCAFPSNFDADYCYSLGVTAFFLIANGRTGYIAAIKNLSKPRTEWLAYGIPVTMLMNMERRSGKEKPVIKKSLVSLDDPAFKKLAEGRKTWEVTTSYIYPGAIQYFGPSELVDPPTKTVLLNAMG
ncbi:MAG: diphosphate--fructose-6-phosphate 1-phosphotransferase [Treponema sp.]|nr:MAG: diphosphate--fructose-6-phosphate 1-phosphotransferase [Treponema sp.]